MNTTPVRETGPHPEHQQQDGPRHRRAAQPDQRPQRSGPTPDGEVGPPYVVLLVGTLLGVVGLVGVVIAWRTGSRAAMRVVAPAWCRDGPDLAARAVRRRAGAAEGRRRSCHSW